ncbi:MAG: hypothetical protein JF599_04570 [Verrucomicrobia bacterium]|nr:hypothetical protein [Verrucomicrobiota bacterium]
MKALPLLLTASLLANVALVATVTMRSSGTHGFHLASGVGSHAAGNTVAAGAGKVANVDVIAALQTGDPEALRDILRAAGFSEEAVRTFVSMSIWKRYEARFKALQPKPDPSKPWWKDDPRQNGWFGNMTRAQREEMRKIQHEQRDETERILGPDKNENGWGWQDPRMAFLSADKRKQLQDIQQDYQELMGEVQQDMQGFQLPSDREKLRFLKEEQKRDIEAMLTPEERQTYELRMSQTAQNLRWQMTRFDATEEEYLKIFPLQKAFDEKYNTNDPYGSYVERDQNFWKERQAAEKQLKEQMKGVIGEQRFADYVRSQESDYQQLQAAARRLDLPADTASRVYSMRDDMTASAKEIAANDNLGPDQKKQALAALAAKARDQVRTALGTEAADAYFKNNGMGWLKEMEKGNVVTFSSEGGGWSSQSVVPPTPKKKPAAAP